MEETKKRLTELAAKIDVLIEEEKKFLPNGWDLMIVSGIDLLKWTQMRGKYIGFGLIVNQESFEETANS